MILKSSRPLKDLSAADLTEVQTCLKKLGYLRGRIDGIFGPLTLKAWQDWKTEVGQGQAEFLSLIGPASWSALQKQVAEQAGKVHNFTSKAGVIEAIKWECRAHGLPLLSQQAYVIATVHHETAQTFRPLEEYWKGRGRPYGKPDPKTGQCYYGRGFVQLTWKSNYQKYSQILGVDLVNKPMLACDPNVALFILVHGFKYGTFTGARLENYVNSSMTDFINARRCINGTDRAHQIADLARQYLKQL